MEKQKQYGFIYETPEPEAWTFGSVSLPFYATKEILRPDGQWDDFLPAREFQAMFGVETMACASYGTLNAIEILEKRKFNYEKNWSDRWLAWNSGTTERGNSPQKVAEYLRRGGVPLQSDWSVTPNINTFEKFYETPPAKLLATARQFLSMYLFKHYIVPSTIDGIKDALKFSPLGISVSAWTRDGDGVYRQTFADNHWCVVFGYDDAKQAWKIFDSYEDTVKLYSYDAKPIIVKGYYLDHAIQGNWVQDLFARFFKG